MIWPYDLIRIYKTGTIIWCIYNKSLFNSFIINGSFSDDYDIYAWIFWFFCILYHFPRYFGTFSICYLAIFDLLQDHIDIPISLGSVPIFFSMHYIDNCTQKSKFGYTFPPFCKCLYASAMFISVTESYHAELWSRQKLVAHVISIEIGD